MEFTRLNYGSLAVNELGFTLVFAAAKRFTMTGKFSTTTGRISCTYTQS